MSFRLKTILGIAIIEALLLALLIISVLNYLYDSNERQLLDRISTTTTLFATTTKDAVLSTDLASLESLVGEMMKHPDLIYAQVLDADGRILAQRGDPASLTRPFHADTSIQDVVDGIFDAAAPIEEAGIPYGRVELGLDVRSLQAVQDEARRHSLLIAGVEMLLVALFSFFLGHYLTRQLGALISASHAVADGELGYQVPVKGHDELARTARAFNRMSLQLQEDADRRDAVMRSALDCIITADEKGRILEFNPAAEASFGYRREQVIGRSLTEIMIPERYHEAHRQGMQHYLQTGRLKHAGERMETFARRADGTEFPAEVAIAVAEVGGRPLFTGYLRDISQRLQAEERLRSLSRAVEQSPASVVITDLHGNIEFVNAKLVEVTGFTASEVIGKNPRVFQSGLTPPERYEALWGALTSGREWRGELINRKKNGDIYWEWASISPVRRPDGTATHYLAVKEDITEQKQAEERLRLAANVFTHAREGIVITDVDGAILEVNDAFERITGYTRQDVIGQNPRILKSNRQGEEFYTNMWRELTERGHWDGEIWNRRKDGEVYAEMLTISAVRNSQGEIQSYVALFSDITAQKEHQRELEHIAHYDALTNLPNRMLLDDRLHQAVAQAERRDQQLALAYIDLDGFKNINDTHGHDTGDKLLITLASRMKQSLREGDTIGRLGGDEFVAVMGDLNESRDSVPLLSRLLNAIVQPVHLGELVLQVSASIGVTFYPQQEAVDADQLLRQADQAMYQAKVAGKNRYHIFDAEQDRNVRGHHESLEHIRNALTQKQFVLYYQPKVNMRSGEVFGAEALIRWQHPERGLLPPSVFLPVIEDHTLAIEVGEWVIDTALSQLQTWHAAGLKIPISVNIGAHQLQQDDFLQRLHSLLAAYPDVDPAMLELEVLETSALEDIVHVSEVINACLEMGLNFALDDFGTGYSSLTYLKRLPATHLKIDQSFVRDMLDDPEDLAILEGVLGLTTAFRRQAIAEGVETVEHGEILLQLGYELAQGYGIARPMPAAELPEWVKTWQPFSQWREQQPISRDDLPLLFASVEHRAWIRAIEEYLHDERSMPPPLNHHHCRFGQWLENDGRKRHGEQATFQAILPLHEQVHTMARELLELKTQGQHLQARKKLTALHGLRDVLLAKLKALIKGR